MSFLDSVQLPTQPNATPGTPTAPTGGGSFLKSVIMPGANYQAPVVPPTVPTASFKDNIINGAKDYAQQSADTVNKLGNALLHPIDTLNKLPGVFVKPLMEGEQKAGDALYNIMSAPKGAGGDVLVANTAKLISGIASSAFSSITGINTIAQNTPGLKQVSDVINVPFTATGFAGSWASGKAIDWIPDNILPQASKDIIKQPIQELSALAAQTVLGGKIMEKISDYASKGEPVTPEIANKIVDESKVETASHPHMSENPPAPTPQVKGGFLDSVQKPGVDGSLASDVYQKTRANGGVTIDTQGGVPSEGYAYAPSKGTEVVVPSDQFNENHVTDFINKNKDLLSQPGNHIGVWESNGKTYIDVSRVGESSPKTIDEAQKAEQLAVYDLKNGKEVSTGQITNGVYNKTNEATNIHNQHQEQVSQANSRGSNESASKISQDQKDSSGSKTSGVASSIEAKAVEAKLTSGFADKAGYDPIAIKDQAEKATNLINSNLDNARSVIRGESPLPEGLRGTALITAMEEYVKKNPNADLAHELANSPLVSATSAAAQEMRLMAERTPDSATAKLQEIKKSMIENAGGDSNVAKSKREMISQAKSETTKVNLPKEELSWDNFLSKIQC